MNWVQQAIAQWKEEELELNSGADIAEIERVENKIGYKFPDDFKNLYLNVNGFIDFEWNGSMLSLWSLGRIEDDYEDANKYIMFGDFFTSLCQYGFDKSNGHIFKAYTHHQVGPVQFIVKSFQELIELFNSNSQLLF